MSFEQLVGIMGYDFDLRLQLVTIFRFLNLKSCLILRNRVALGIRSRSNRWVLLGGSGGRSLWFWTFFYRFWRLWVKLPELGSCSSRHLLWDFCFFDGWNLDSLLRGFGIYMSDRLSWRKEIFRRNLLKNRFSFLESHPPGVSWPKCLQVIASLAQALEWSQHRQVNVCLLLRLLGQTISRFDWFFLISCRCS